MKHAVTPPGYKTDIGAGNTTKCSSTPGAGEFRAEWKPYTAAATCTACGDGISVELLDQVTSHPLGVATIENVTTSADACCEWLVTAVTNPPFSLQLKAVTEGFKCSWL